MKRARVTEPSPSSSSQAANFVDDNRNPMLNEVVVKRLFELIPFNCRDFKSFRLVSKLWMNTTFPLWRQEAWLHVKAGRRRPDDIYYVFLDDYINKMNMPGDPHQLLGDHAFQNYKITSSIEKNGAFSLEHVPQFWSKVGGSITHLEVSQSNIQSLTPQLARVIYELCPNLRFLSLDRNVYSFSGTHPRLHNRGVGDHERRLIESMKPSSPDEVRGQLTHLEITWNDTVVRPFGDFRLFWIHLFFRFPNIRTFKLRFFPKAQNIQVMRHGQERVLNMNRNYNIVTVFRALQLVRHNGGEEALTQLEHLDLLNMKREASALLPPEMPMTLGAMAFPLSTLAFDIGYEPRGAVARFRTILEFYSRTLKKLVVYRGPYGQPFEENFPYGVDLPHLKELILIGHICGNLNFLRNTPALKTLVLLDGQTPTETGVVHSYLDFPLRSLLDKHVEGIEEISDKVNVVTNTDFGNNDMLKLVLPQMEQFVVGHELCGADQVEGLAKLMPGLKTLRLGLGNEGFEEVCKSWTQLKELDIEPFDVEEVGILGMKDGIKYSQPNLTDLKYLTSIRFGVHSEDSNKGRLTNGAVLDGLLVAESLRSVSYARAPKVTKKVRELFNTKFPQ